MIDTKFKKSNKQAVSLYNGEIELTFSNSGHRYQVGGRECVGVTTVLRTISKPALIPWAVKMTADYLTENLKPGVAYDEVQLQKMIEESKKAHRNIKRDAADFGTMVHSWIEAYINGANPPEPVNEQMRKATGGFVKWAKENKVTFTASEKIIYSRRYNYAGMCDFTCEIDGKKYVGDIKTSNAIYNEYLMQVSAYRYALQEENPGVIYDGMLIVRVPKDEGDVEIAKFNNYVENAKAFIYTLELYNHLQRMKNFTNGVQLSILK